MKSATVYYKHIPAGTLIKDDEGYLLSHETL